MITPDTTDETCNPSSLGSRQSISVLDLKKPDATLSLAHRRLVGKVGPVAQLVRAGRS
jgi:hypothetical protein